MGSVEDEATAGLSLEMEASSFETRFVVGEVVRFGGFFFVVEAEVKF